jgi:aspartate kinase
VTPPLVVKLGGDALASPERIVAAARRLAERRGAAPVVAVASARRGVTDHLLGLVERVREAGIPGATVGGLAAADRAAAAGEIVAASLLVLALDGLGIPAVTLDAREAGLASTGHAGRARLTAVRPARVQALLGRGVVPVVAGFQGWHRGRVTTLGRGGSDTTAVALASALGAAECELVKETGGVLTADPGLVPEAERIPAASHRFLSELASAGARVIHHPAAAWAEREALPLRFTALTETDWSTEVTSTAHASSLWAVTLRAGRSRFSAPLGRTVARDLQPRLQQRLWEAGLTVDAEAVQDATGWRLDLLTDAPDLDDCLRAIGRLVGMHQRPVLVQPGLSTLTVVTAAPTHPRSIQAAVQDAVAERGARLLHTVVHPHRTAFLVHDADGPELLRAVHDRIAARAPAHLGAA